MQALQRCWRQGLSGARPSPGWHDPERNGGMREREASRRIAYPVAYRGAIHRKNSGAIRDKSQGVPARAVPEPQRLLQENYCKLELRIIPASGVPEGATNRRWRRTVV